MKVLRPLFWLFLALVAANLAVHRRLWLPQLAAARERFDGMRFPWSKPPPTGLDLDIRVNAEGEALILDNRGGPLQDLKVYFTEYHIELQSITKLGPILTRDALPNGGRQRITLDSLVGQLTAKTADAPAMGCFAIFFTEGTPPRKYLHLLPASVMVAPEVKIIDPIFNAADLAGDNPSDIVAERINAGQAMLAHQQAVWGPEFEYYRLPAKRLPPIVKADLPPVEPTEEAAP
ncbi:MAG: hypothetical protein A2X36_10235 [Elusimicrobia bacterium GWA2_69_24]|nr:MAG: hypothetical protein A2X36_10235 [Elusimicrobia bacterium GWA2_69_24]HBL19215.1 hypothetical protein [Elusimicrobiota bacterium]